MLALVHPSTVYTDVPRPRSMSRKLSSSSARASSTPSSVPMARTKNNSHHPPRPASPPRLVKPSPPSPPPVDPPNVEETEDEEDVDIHAIPQPDLLKMLASLLQQIASQNDNLPPPDPSPTPPLDRVSIPDLTDAGRRAILNPQSTLTFHARNVPTISLEAYLLRILKYCPTTNEVFLSLLVYFERMGRLGRLVTGATGHPHAATPSGQSQSVAGGLVIDSFNVHRLIIAGVTVASKFFSDVFYTNSRYAKVGGLPLPELNSLELQFLLLNNFHLVIPHDEMQRYARELVRFGQRTSPSTSSPASPTTKSKLNVSGSQTPPDPEQLRKQQEMGAIDAYGGSLPNNFEKPGSSSAVAPSQSQPSVISTSSKQSLFSAPPTMASHPFLPSTNSAPHPFLPGNHTPSRPHPFLPNSAGLSSSRPSSGHFLQPGANGFDHLQGFGFSYDVPITEPAASAPPHATSFGQAKEPLDASRLTPGRGIGHRPRVPSTSSSRSETSSLFTSDSEAGDAETEDGSTEDEPTIRPNRSERGSVCSFNSSTTSLYSEFGERSGSEVEMSDAEADNEGAKTPEINAELQPPNDGERTPETAAGIGGSGDNDVGMASP